MESSNSKDYSFLLTMNCIYVYSESKGLSYIEALDNVTATEESLEPRERRF